MTNTDGFVEAILEAPIGVVLLGRLESCAIHRDTCHNLPDTSPRGVEAAVALVETMPFGEFIDLVVYCSVIDAGPWVEPQRTAAEAYRDASQRAPIACAISERFGDELHNQFDGAAQQWWTTTSLWQHTTAPLFQNYEHVYYAGQFTWAGLWTVSDPPPFAHAQIASAWEMWDGPLTRWHLPPKPGVRIYEINRPEDWANLVVAHPRQAASRSECWELPSINRDRHHLDHDGLELLFNTPGQRASRRTMRNQLVPDWRSVAEHYDAVHLSWAGFITSEGCITDLDDGDVTMLRYWFAERTHWLADVFGEPEPALPPFIPWELEDGSPSTVRIGDEEERQQRDRIHLDELLGRRPISAARLGESQERGADDGCGPAHGCSIASERGARNPLLRGVATGRRWLDYVFTRVRRRKQLHRFDDG